MRKNPFLNNLPKPEKLINAICQIPSKKKSRKEVLRELGFVNPKRTNLKEESTVNQISAFQNENNNIERIKIIDDLREKLISELRYVIASAPFKIRSKEASKLEKRLKSFTSVYDVSGVMNEVLEPEKLNLAYLKIIDIMKNNNDEGDN